MLSSLLVLAQATPDPEADFEGFAKAVFEAVTSGNWPIVGTLAGLLVVWLLWKFGAKKIPFLAGDAGKAVIGFLWTAARKLVPLFLTKFGRKGATERANDAGDRAVAEKPATGISGVMGNPTPVVIAAFEANMISQGYIKQEDGSWKRVKRGQ